MNLDSFELSKIFGAIFAALLLILVPKTLIEISRQSHGDEKGGYTLPSAAPSETSKDTAAKDAAVPPQGKDAPSAGASVASLLAAASADNGKAVFGKCAACHTATKGGANALGPNLWGIVGRKVGGVDGFGYSAPLKKKGEEGWIWDFDKLAQWVQADDKLVPGNKMIFPGIPDPANQADLLAYLRTLSDSPAPLPK